MTDVSPQIESYQHFRQELAGRIQQGLQALLERLRATGRIGFTPAVSVTLPAAPLASAAEAGLAVQTGSSLVEPIHLGITLGREDGNWSWPIGDLPWMAETGAFVDNGYERFMLLQLRQEDRDAADPWGLDNFRVRRVGQFLDEAVDIWRAWLEQRLARQEERLGFGQCRDRLIEANRGRTEQTLFSQLTGNTIWRNPLSQRVTLEAQGGGEIKRACLGRAITHNGPGERPIQRPVEAENGEKPASPTPNATRINRQADRQRRQFHWSHIGRLCPLDTSQGDDVGLTLALTVSARIDAEGRIAARYHPVEHTANGIRIAARETFLHAGEEAALTGWIAFPDQREALQRGEAVYAHRGAQALERVTAREVSHIHVAESDLFSVAANWLPYRRYNDPLRGTMACHFLRQALPLADMAPPRMGGTGFGSDIACGRELRVGYLPWYGYNFEDALVISASAADALTSVITWRVRLPLWRSATDHELASALRRNEISVIRGLDPEKYDDRGLMRVGQWVTADEPLALEPLVSRMRAEDETHRFHLHYDPRRRAGQVAAVTLIPAPDPGQSAFVEFVLQESPRRAEPGDKLANRHGHKGVIGRILPDEQMPYVLLDTPMLAETPCLCGETRPHRHLQVLINPLSVISRMNLGQLHETVAARSPEWASLPDKVPCFDPGRPGRPSLNSAVLVGEQYFLKLDHNAADKVRARAQEPEYYSALTQQPPRGLRLKGGRWLPGGQRLGEMEVWALMAHNVPALLQEMLTVKSDAPRARAELAARLSQGREAQLERVDLPEGLRTLAACLLGLGVQAQVIGRDGRTAPLISTDWPPEAFASLRLEPLDPTYFRQHIAHGEVKTTRLGAPEQPDPDGLQSRQIFGPLKSYTCACGRYQRQKPHRADQCCEQCQTPLLPATARRRRFGYIALAAPIPNPWAVRYGRIELPGGLAASRLLAKPPELTFNNWQAAETFIAGAAACSPRLCAILEQATDCRLQLAMPTPTGGLPNDAVRALREARERTLEAQGALSPAEWIEKQRQQYGDDADGRESFCAWLAQLLDADRLEILVELLRARPETAGWVLDVLPVIPPALRPAVRAGSRPIVNDLQLLYRDVLKANAELAEVVADRDRADPQARQRYQERRETLQQRVAQLMINQHLPWRQRNRHVQQSLSLLLEGKRGLLTGHLLGKRVDFSGRAVIVPDPELPLDECRLPALLALGLFRLQLQVALAERQADPERLIAVAQAGDAAAWAIIEPTLARVVSGRLVLLNRQPTLHRLGLLAFRARLGGGSAIGLPVMATTGFNADFDGDQMAVYLPLTGAAIQEAERLLPSRHLWHPADGRYALSLAQDLALGGYLQDGRTRKERAAVFAQRVAEPDLLAQIEQFQRQAFARVTASGLSFSGADAQALAAAGASPGDAAHLRTVIEAREAVDPFHQMLVSGARGDWDKLVELAGCYHPEWPADWPQTRLAGGLSDGEWLERAGPARNNLVETKLSTAEGGTLTKELVARAQGVWITGEDCGTEQGIEVSAWALINRQGMPETRRQLDEQELAQRLYGRTLAGDYAGDWRRDVDLDAEQARALARRLIQEPDTAVRVRSPATCEASMGVCRKCYGLPPTAGRERRGWDFADRVALNSRVGLIAAQAVGEPGTQLALDSKHGDRKTRPVNEVRQFIRNFRKTKNAMPEVWRDTLADIYGEQGMAIAPVHFETLWRQGVGSGWLAEAAAKTDSAALHQTLIRAAMEGQSDDLTGLKENALLGAPLPRASENT